MRGLFSGLVGRLSWGLQIQAPRPSKPSEVVSVGRRCAAPSELFHFQTPAARRSRSEEPGLFDEQKLLYILLHPKHWVSAAGVAVGQSYGREGDGLTLA